MSSRPNHFKDCYLISARILGEDFDWLHRLESISGKKDRLANWVASPTMLHLQAPLPIQRASVCAQKYTSKWTQKTQNWNGLQTQGNNEGKTIGLNSPVQQNIDHEDVNSWAWTILSVSSNPHLFFASVVLSSTYSEWPPVDTELPVGVLLGNSKLSSTLRAPTLIENCPNENKKDVRSSAKWSLPWFPKFNTNFPSALWYSVRFLPNTFYCLSWGYFYPTLHIPPLPLRIC